MAYKRDLALPETTPRKYTKSDLSLPKGITKYKDRYLVRVSVNSKRIGLGVYKELDEALECLQGYYQGNSKPSRCCTNCSKVFLPINTRQVFCSTACRGQWKYTSGSKTTQTQYDLISGNWPRYCSRLLYVAGRKRDELTQDDLLKLLEKQNYCCALSGIPLTCELQVGIKSWTNASVDRVIPGGNYTKNNIQLVCNALNSWRSNTPLEDCIEICRLVAEKHPRGESLV